MECEYTSYINNELGLGWGLRYRLGNKKQGYCHQHDFFELMIILDGNFTILLEGNKMVPLKKNMISLLPPDSIHQSNATGMNIQLGITRKTLEQLNSFLFGGKLKIANDIQTYSMTNNQSNYIKSQIQFASLIDTNDSEKQTIILRKLLTYIFTEIIHPIISSSINNLHDVPLWFFELINKCNSLEFLSCNLNEMSEEVKVSKEYLCRCFKKYTGMTASEYLNNRRMFYAANMLKNSNTEIIRICEDIGMSSLSYFYKVFKRNFGLSPSAFRKNKNQ